MENYGKPLLILAIVGLSFTGSVLSQQSSTAAPSTTPVAPPAPTPAPPTPVSCTGSSTKPKPSEQTYAFKTCLVAKFAAYFKSGADQYIELKNGKVDANRTTCENETNSTAITTPRLVITFECGELQFEMGQVNNTQIFVKSINGKYTVGNSTVYFKNSTELFKTTAENHYYKCNSEQSVEDDTKKSSLVLSDLAFEAYRKTSGTDFYKVPEECALDSSQVSDLVRIGVGICLVALVALVLIAYFVGRRRWAERSSYESV